MPISPARLRLKEADAWGLSASKERLWAGKESRDIARWERGAGEVKGLISLLIAKVRVGPLRALFFLFFPKKRRAVLNTLRTLQKKRATPAEGCAPDERRRPGVGRCICAARDAHRRLASSRHKSENATPNTRHSDWYGSERRSPLARSSSRVYCYTMSALAFGVDIWVSPGRTHHIDTRAFSTTPTQ